VEAYRLAKEVREELFQDKTSASSLLRKCRTIAKLLKKKSESEWIELELDGYSERFPTYKELKSNLPPYRWAVRQFLDQWGKPILVTGKMADLIQDFPLVQSVAELEGFASTGMYIHGDEAIVMLRDKFKVPALQSHVPPHRVVRAIDAVKTRIQEFADSIISELAQTPGSQVSSYEQVATSVQDPRKVSVVYGRNLKARDALFAFLRSIELDPIEWSQAVAATGKGTPYVGEILDKMFSMAQAVVVLMTPDDEAQLRAHLRRKDEPSYETELTPQARANVLFEAGMAIGRYPERTVLVQLGPLRPFSDIGGRHVVKFDGSTQKRQELAQRLLTAGCPANLGGTDWHTKGSFEIDLDHKIDNQSSVKVGRSAKEDEISPTCPICDGPLRRVQVEEATTASYDPWATRTPRITRPGWRCAIHGDFSDDQLSE